MPEYDHSIVRVNRARGIQMLQNTFTCDPTLLWTPERANTCIFPPRWACSVAGWCAQAGRWWPLLDGQQVEPASLADKTRLKLGIVAERSYGRRSTHLAPAARQRLSRHYGNDATASLLQMQQLGRLRLVLGYWPEVRYLIQQQGGSLATTSFYPIRAWTATSSCMWAARTPKGREAIAHIDQLLPACAGHPARPVRPLAGPGTARDYLQTGAFLRGATAPRSAALAQKETPALGKTPGVKRKPGTSRGSASAGAKHWLAAPDV
jgi:uncharacterized protein (TIGR02285 family)